MNKSDLTRVLSALGLRVSSENTTSHFLNCSCPFASFGLHRNRTDNSASFGARYDEHGVSSFKCHACKQSGSIRKLVRQLGQLRNVDYSALLQQVTEIEQLGLSSMSFEPFDRDLEPEQVLVPLNEALYDGLYPAAWDVPEARAYLEARRISPETAENIGLLYRDIYHVERQDGSVGEWFRGDILFPVRDRDGKLYGWSGRTTRDAAGIKPKVYDKDLPKRHLILGEERWIEGRPTVIVEGLFGYAWLIEIGVEEFANVGALMGSVLTPEKATILRAWGNPVVALLDNDEAGDIGLFGKIDPVSGQREPELSMVSQLISSLVVIVPEWPSLFEPIRRKDGSWQEFKDDPDQLTVEEVWAMVFSTTPVPPPPAPRARKYPVDKHFKRRYN